MRRSKRISSWVAIVVAALAIYVWAGRGALEDACCAPPAGPAFPGPSLASGGAPIDSAASTQASPPPPARKPRVGWLGPTLKAVARDDADARQYEPIDFGLLGGFDYGDPRPWDIVDARRESEPRGRFEIPARIRALSGKRVALEGFMMPMDFDGSTVGEFILNGSYDMCAFGMPARLNDWALVRFKGGKRTRFAGHFPITVYGRLDVGEKWRVFQIDSLYRLESDFIGIPAEDLEG